MKIYILSLYTILVLTGCTLSDKNFSNKDEVSNIHNSDYRNNLALHDAIRAKDFKIAELLINTGSKLNVKDKYGYTPLHLTAIFNEDKTAELLIQKDAIVDNVDRYGDTPLIDSTRNDFNNISRIMVCAGIKVDVADKNGITPLHYASKNNNLYLAQLLTTKHLEPFCKEGLSITLQPSIQTAETTPNICGTAQKGILNDVSVTILDALEQPYGPFMAKIDETGQNWCAKVTTPLPVGEYHIQAKAKSKALTKAEATSKLEVIEAKEGVVETPLQEDFFTQPTQQTTSDAKSLHDALFEEFKDDFYVWNAVLSDDLSIRFKDPILLFKSGNSDLSSSYKKILNNFIPRYITLLKKYKDQIASVEIQGHTSSDYSSANTDEEKFKKNETLSLKRANRVLNFILASQNESVIDNLDWIEQYFKAVGKSSSQLITNDDGTENKELSKRVEFKIILR
ncbi:MAG: ankyrin repeat domain-containing protein [Candidatus Marinarcus sp.]|uniref:ankyrin repeat domain-containing protein n=1 Tax=Candidatus Marinarcus sp. TaxID=3100987 RepID=UPI003B008F98